MERKKCIGVRCTIIIIIMNIYHVLINDHMIHININTIVATHLAQHSPTNATDINYYAEVILHNMFTINTI